MTLPRISSWLRAIVFAFLNGLAANRARLGVVGALGALTSTGRGEQLFQAMSDDQALAACEGLQPS